MFYTEALTLDASQHTLYSNRAACFLKLGRYAQAHEDALERGEAVGHALERVCPPGDLGHGEAVAIGLVCEARWAEKRGLCEESGFAARLARCLVKFGLPVEVPHVPLDALCEAMRLDKKVIGDTLGLPVPRRAGHYVMVDIALDELQSLVKP